MGLEAEILRALQSLARQNRFTYRIKEEQLSSSEPMNIDSLEFTTLLVDAETRFNVSIPDEEVHERKLNVLKNLVDYIAASHCANGNARALKGRKCP